MRRGWTAVGCALFLWACKSAPSGPQPAASASADPSATPVPAAPTPCASAAPAEAPPPTLPDPRRYTWLDDKSAGAPAAVDTLLARFPTPPSYERVKVEPGTFGHWLRHLPLAAPKTPVENVKGAIVHPGDDQYLGAVVAIDYGKIDLQQSPDVVIRLHAEWLWAQGEKNISYRSATGLDMPLSRWARGERLETQGASVIWLTKGRPAELDHAEFRQYLNGVFTWANSTSLAQQSDPVQPADLAPGDFFLHTGSPGHALVVLDVAKKEDGKIVALFAQGLNPSQSVHVLQAGRATAWFSLRPGEPVITPHTKEFPWEGLRRLGKPKPTE
ncbi:MAG: hypothetical protein IT377_24065 [Polyangiaceae bacterium]|nr:hypothetical protein [Polyangiaceae bacterium]